MRVEVISVHDTTDGGCRVLVEMDEDTMIQFMRVGLVFTLLNAANETLAQHEEDDEVL
jgi:hypothetical protein